MAKTWVTYDIRLTGSSQTMVTQGVWAMIWSTGRSAIAVPPAGTTDSPSDSGIKAIVASFRAEGDDPPTPPQVAIGWHGDRPTARTGRGGTLGSERGADHRTADRPLRADHAPSGPARGHRVPALRLRAVCPSAARRPPLRRGGRSRPGAAGATAVPVRRRVAALPARPGDRGLRDRGLAGRVRLPRRHLGLPRRRGLLSRFAGGDRGRHLRRGCGAGDPAAEHLQPRLRQSPRPRRG